MGFDADAAADKVIADYPPFGFTWQDDEFELPNLAVISTDEAVALSGAMNRASNPEAGDTEAVFELVELLDQVCGKEAGKAIREMPAAVMAQLVVAWQESAETDMADLGKERSPSSPRNRQERRSKSTSQRKAKTSGGSRSTKSEATSAA